MTRNLRWVAVALMIGVVSCGTFIALAAALVLSTALETGSAAARALGRATQWSPR